MALAGQPANSHRRDSAIDCRSARLASLGRSHSVSENANSMSKATTWSGSPVDREQAQWPDVVYRDANLLPNFLPKHPDSGSPNLTLQESVGLNHAVHEPTCLHEG